MKTTILAYLTGTALLLTAPVQADGLSTAFTDPEVIAPADWTGFYAGLSYGQNESRKPRTTCKPQSVKTVTPEPVCETAIVMYEAQNAGGFAGYRRDWGRLVGGVEIGTAGGMTTGEVQIGYDAGDAVIYGFAGAGQFDGESGTTFGAGIDVKLGERWLVGVKHTEGSFGETDSQGTMIRLAVRF
jgi:outer membrane immunogenic protein